MVEIRLEKISHAFAKRQVLTNVSHIFRSGLITAVAGANGSGKSTLLRIAARLITPTSGSVIATEGNEAIGGADLRRRLAMNLPEMELYSRLTVRENLAFILGLRRKDLNDDIFRALLQKVGLNANEILAQPVATLSTGMRQRLKLAIIFGADASIWLLDEPCLALDAAGREMIFAAVRSAADSGKLIIWATNDAEERAAADECVCL